MSKQAWIIAGTLTAAIILVSVGFLFVGKQRELEQMRTELTEARTALAKSQGEVGDLGSKLSAGQARIDELQKEKEAAVQTVAQTRQSLEQEMRAALESKDVTISQLQGKLTVNILDRILFDSGEAELKPDGAEVLRKVAVILAQHPNLKIHVIGHTDDVPIRAAARKRFPSNWELSTTRATAAVRFLCEQAGVDPRRLGAVGYGEFRPVAENSTAEGRAKNRRIAISILSEEMAGSDVAPTVATNVPVAIAVTNAPAPVVTPVSSVATNAVPQGTNGSALPEPKAEGEK